MKTFSNLYIFCFSSVLVLVVAGLLSFTAIVLEDRQRANINIERKQMVLVALGVQTTKSNVFDKYQEFIKDGIIIKAVDGSEVGKITEEIEMNLLSFLKRQNDTPLNERLLLLYRAEKGGKQYVVIPVRGAGLWGPIWGNVAIDFSDMSTVYGVTFDHSGETPGLGSQIGTTQFWDQFRNKRIFDANGRFVSISVEKPGTYTPNNHTVDGISGGTITGNKLDEMLRNSLEQYLPFFRQQKSN